MKLQFRVFGYMALALTGLAMVFTAEAVAQQNNQNPFYRGLVAPSNNTGSTYRRQQQPSGGYSGLTSGSQGSQHGAVPQANPYARQGNQAMSAAEKKRLENQRLREMREQGRTRPRKTLEQKFNAGPEKLARIRALRESRAKRLQERRQEYAAKKAQEQRAQQFKRTNSIALP